MRLKSAPSDSTVGLSQHPIGSIPARCQQAGRLEEAGRYDEAVEALDALWKGVGLRPNTEEMEPHLAAEVLLRVGSLSGWLGSINSVPEAQENAKNLVSEAASLFEDLGNEQKTAEARVNLAVCYWREGALDEARVILQDVLDRIGGKNNEQELRALLGLAMVERRATRYNEALRILQQAAPLLDELSDHGLKGRFFTQLGNVLENIGRNEARSDFIDRALLEYAAACYHVEQTGNLGFCASVENNQGFLFYMLGRNAEAHEHLTRAQQLFERAGDQGARLAQVEDTRARVFLAEDRFDEAEASSRSAVRRLEGGDEQSLLAEALITHGTTLARMADFGQAERVLRRAEEVAERSGDLQGSGMAALTLLEEVGQQLDATEATLLFERADDLLSRSQDTEVSLRLRRCARRLLSLPRAVEEKAAPPEFIYASERTAELLCRAKVLAKAVGPTILLGETGTGKEILARLIHQWSGRAGKFVTIRCAGLSEPLFEVKLFGGMSNDSLDASDNRDEEVAGAGSTLFLDEVSALSLSSQATLLRFLDCLESGSEQMPSSRGGVRVIASTNTDLAQFVADGLFRDDLFYRLQNFHITIPPLRERAEDIPALAEHFISQARTHLPERGVTFTPEAVRAMALLPLHGNARELKSLIERTLLMAEEGTTVTPEMVEAAALSRGGADVLTDPWDNFSLKDEIHRIERRFIELALRDSKGMVSRASKLLGFKHHESLASLLKSRHRELLSARTPVKPRRRSIMRKAAH